MSLQVICNTPGWKDCPKGHTIPFSTFNNKSVSTIPTYLALRHRASTGSTLMDLAAGLLVRVAQCGAGYLEPATNAISFGRNVMDSIRVLTASVSLGDLPHVPPWRNSED